MQAECVCSSMYPASLTRAFLPFPHHTRTLSSDRLEVEGGPRWPREFSGFLAEPASPLLVLEDRHVLARREHDVEVAPPHGRVRPPAVDDAPLFAHWEGPPLLHRSRYPLLNRDAHRSRLVQSSRGTRIALASGIRDHGATSTTVQTASIPIATRTWRSHSRRGP